jgi:hypothetical protein
VAEVTVFQQHQLEFARGAAHHQRPTLAPAFAKRSLAFGPAVSKAAVPRLPPEVMLSTSVAVSGSSKRQAQPVALPGAKRNTGAKQKVAAPPVAAGAHKWCQESTA